jgi:hypothetical protein
MRYRLDDTSKIFITYVDIQGMMLSVTNSSTGAFSLIGSLQLMDITITVIPGSNTTGTLTLEWFGERIPETNETLIYGQGVPMKYHSRPPPESYASFWISSDDDYSSYSDAALFSLDIQNIIGDLSDGCVAFLDFHFKYTIVDGPAKSYTLSSAATFTGVACPRLGFQVPGSTRSDDLFPVGVNQVTVTNTI